MTEKLREIGELFGISGEIKSAEAIKNGNINKTYKVTYSHDGGEDVTYVFQKINTYVFKEPEKIMENIDTVLSHIHSKETGGISPEFLRTSNGLNYAHTDKGFWRIMNYIDSVTFDTGEDPKVIESTGEAFGEFQMLLSDLDGSMLHETIPGFHNTRQRLDKLFSTAEADLFDRAGNAAGEIEYIRSVYPLAVSLWDRYAAGDFPVRVTHNDTKSNNVLFDKVKRRPICVIDLDTVMPGMAMYDFGDGVRSSCSTAVEDEADLEKVFVDTDKFAAFCRGYMSRVRDSLTREETDSLVLGAFSVTVELGARFLTDYLEGDKYFKAEYPEHNLVRGKCQLKLAKDIVGKCDILSEIVKASL